MQEISHIKTNKLDQIKVKYWASHLDFYFVINPKV